MPVYHTFDLRFWISLATSPAGAYGEIWIWVNRCFRLLLYWVQSEVCGTPAVASLASEFNPSTVYRLPLLSADTHTTTNRYNHRIS